MKEQGKYTDHIPEASANFINRSLNADGVGEDIRSTTVEFLPFGLDWTCVAEIQFSENKDLPNDNDPPRRQKVRNSTVEKSWIMQLRMPSVADSVQQWQIGFLCGSFGDATIN